MKMALCRRTFSRKWPTFERRQRMPMGRDERFDRLNAGGCGEKAEGRGQRDEKVGNAKRSQICTTRRWQSAAPPRIFRLHHTSVAGIAQIVAVLHQHT